MSNSYVLGIAVGIAFGIMLVAFIFSYLKKKGKDICEYDERQKLAQLKGWKAAFIAAVCFDIINAMAVDIFGPLGEYDHHVLLLAFYRGRGIRHSLYYKGCLHPAA